MAKKKRKRKLRSGEVKRRRSRKKMLKRASKPTRTIKVEPSKTSTSSGIGVMKTKVVDPNDPNFYPEPMREMAKDMLEEKPTED